jgi:hypothetical protein
MPIAPTADSTAASIEALPYGQTHEIDFQSFSRGQLQRCRLQAMWPYAPAAAVMAPVAVKIPAKDRTLCTCQRGNCLAACGHPV